MNEYTLYNADCLDVFGQLAPQSVDAVICDPPYGTTACKWDSVIPFDAMWHGIKRVLRPRGACVLFGSQPFTSALVMSNVKWFRYEWIWEKTAASGHLNANAMPLRAHENILIFGGQHYNPQRTAGIPYTWNSKRSQRGAYGKHGNAPIVNAGTRHPRTVLRFKNERGLHPTQKPLALLEYLVRTYTNAGDLVLDFAMGSGTTGHACANTQRRFVGIEKDEGYFDSAAERIATAYAPLRHMEQDHARV